MKAVRNFKRLVDPAKAIPVLHSILGQEHDSHMVQPPLQIEPGEGHEGLGVFKRVINERDLAGGTPAGSSQESFHERGRSPKRHESEIANKHSRAALMRAAAALSSSASREETPSRSISEGTRGHARDPLEEDFQFLHIGPSSFSLPKDRGNKQAPPGEEGDTILPLQTEEERTGHSRPVLPPLSTPDTSLEGIPVFPQASTPIESDVVPVISESPGASEIDIYETAYREEIDRIRKRSLVQEDQSRTRIYLTRRVEAKKKHLEEVMKMVSSGAMHPIHTAHQYGHDHGFDHKNDLKNDHKNDGTADSTMHQVSDKVSGAIASAGAAFSEVFNKGANAGTSLFSSTASSSQDEEKSTTK